MARFPETSLSLIGDAQGGSSPALDALSRIYRPPIQALFAWWCATRAEELTQELLAKLFKPGGLASFKPGRGKFRNWVFRAARNHWIDTQKKAQAQKQIPPSAMVDGVADGHLLEPVDGSDPERLFNRHYAITLLEQGLDRLREQYEKDNKARLFDEMLPFLIGFGDRQQQDVANQLGMKANTFTQDLCRFRGRFCDLFKGVIAQTVSADEIEEEVRFIFHVLRSRKCEPR